MQSPRTKSSQNKTFLGSRDVFKKMQKKNISDTLGLVRQYNSPKPYCSPSIIIQGNFHLSKHPRERFDRFFTAQILPSPRSGGGGKKDLGKFVHISPTLPINLFGVRPCNKISPLF